jgi:hypothetical protein
MEPIRDNNDVVRWLSIIQPKRCVTKSDIVDLADRLFRHVARRQERKDADSQECFIKEHTLKRNAIESIVTVAARTVSERANLGAQRTIVKFGTTWGRWSYQNDPRYGPCIKHSSGSPAIPLARVSTPEGIGHTISHISDKDWLSPDDLGDATAALIACFIDG